VSQKRPRSHPRNKQVANVATPETPAQAARAPAVVPDREHVTSDDNGLLAIGLAVGALAVVAVMIVLIMMAAN
jgi:hypothetical protein